MTYTNIIVRLIVVRSILAETMNAEKSAKPFKTDVQVLSLLRKRVASSMEAAKEFGSNHRQDLQEKELAQVAVLEEYASEVKTISIDEITDSIQKTLSAIRSERKTINAGTVMKEIIGPHGLLNGKPVESGEVARIIKSMI